MRLSQIARKLNVGTDTIVSFLQSKGQGIENKPNSKITKDQLDILSREFGGLSSEPVTPPTPNPVEQTPFVSEEPEVEAQEEKKTKKSPPHFLKASAPKLRGITQVGHVAPRATKPTVLKVAAQDNEAPQEEKELKKEEPKTSVPASKEKESKAPEAETKRDSEAKEREQPRLKGLTVLGSVKVSPDLPFQRTTYSSQKSERSEKPQRGVFSRLDTSKSSRPGKRQAPTHRKHRSLSDDELQRAIKRSLEDLRTKSNKKFNRGAYIKEKKERMAKAREQEDLIAQESAQTIQVSEFVSGSELSKLLGISIDQLLGICMDFGIIASINQRLDAETITIIADEVGKNVEFVTMEEVAEVVEDCAHLVARPPIVTVMGHVDHGKTSLLDHIRHTKVAAGEAGGITQHIGAYDVRTAGEHRIIFLDTPGHEAFTAMRARGTRVTDIAIIIVAADDGVMPQTKEAITHAQLASTPIIIAINKIDKPGANVDKVKEQLSQQDILVEDWGGKYQCQAISAQTGEGVEALLEKVLIEAELLELKADPTTKATGIVIEASLDQGRGYLTSVIIQNGTLKKGDIIVSGSLHGKVKAMFDSRGKNITAADPATPVQILGLSGAPQSGEKLLVMESERVAREAASRHEKMRRSQRFRSQHIVMHREIDERIEEAKTLDLNLVIKGDVDGSIEALADALGRLSNEEVQVHIVYKAVGPISESDVLLTATSKALLIGFQVKPTARARAIAIQEKVIIKSSSIIYETLDQVKEAIEQLTKPSTIETTVGKADVKKTFNISRAGTIAGCVVMEGTIKRNNLVRLLRDGEEVYKGTIKQLKREKEVIKEAKKGSECGIHIEGFNDIQAGDVIEAIEVKSA
jgi:translation initiation factor IF-2